MSPHALVPHYFHLSKKWKQALESVERDLNLPSIRKALEAKYPQKTVKMRAQLQCLFSDDKIDVFARRRDPPKNHSLELLELRRLSDGTTLVITDKFIEHLERQAGLGESAGPGENNRYATPAGSGGGGPTRCSESIMSPCEQRLRGRYLRSSSRTASYKLELCCDNLLQEMQLAYDWPSTWLRLGMDAGKWQGRKFYEMVVMQAQLLPGSTTGRASTVPVGFVGGHGGGGNNNNNRNQRHDTIMIAEHDDVEETESGAAWERAKANIAKTATVAELKEKLEKLGALAAEQALELSVLKGKAEEKDRLLAVANAEIRELREVLTERDSLVAGLYAKHMSNTEKIRAVVAQFEMTVRYLKEDEE